jgi:hypothetical protein
MDSQIQSIRFEVTLSNIGGLLGTAGGFKGTGVSGPQNPVTPGQMNTAYAGVQSAQQAQQDLLSALQSQNGLGNQTQVYNQLQGVANGTGPNPAAAQLAQATGANTANQASLMAGQRGASQNVGLMARQAAQQGAANQQSAAGQAATMQANQSLNALGQLSGQANTMAANQIGQTNANVSSQQAEQQSLLSANQGMNMVNAGLISGTSQQQAAIGGGSMQGVGSMMSAASGSSVSGAEGGIVPNMYADGGYSGDAQSAYQGKSKFGAFLSSMGQGVSGESSNNSQNPLTSGLNSLGKGIGTLIHNQNKTSSSDSNLSGELGSDDTDAQYLGADAELGSGGDSSSEVPNSSMDVSGDVAAAEGGKVPALLSPGEQYLPPKDVNKVMKEGKNPLSVGERIPGEPKHPGNDYRNDTVKKTLESGGLVIPNKVMQSDRPHWEAMKFVHAHMAKNKKRLPSK